MVKRKSIMKVMFLRHGESKRQAKQVALDAPDTINVLSDIGIEQVKVAARAFHGNIDVVFASPYTRTQLTARIFLQELGIKKPIIIDERLREIDYGYHNGEIPKKVELTEVAIQQAAGNYEIRFGQTGENKREIVTRFFEFLVDIFNKYSETDSILAVSHGRAISILNHEFCEINNMYSEHGGTNNAQIRTIELTPERIANIIQRLKTLTANQH